MSESTEQMYEVPKEYFFSSVGKLNVHPHIQKGPWPYTSIWKHLYSGKVVGKSIDADYPAKTRYFVTGAFKPKS